MKLHIHQNNSPDYLKEWVDKKDLAEQKGFTWASLEENDDVHQYMSLDVVEVDNNFIRKLQEDTIRVSLLVQKTYEIIMSNEKYFQMLGLPIETWGISKEKWPHLFSYFCRYDIIPTPFGNKFIEINSDTPTGYLETSVANKILCDSFDLKSPNRMEDAINNAWIKIIQDYGIIRDDVIYFTSLGWHDEDRQTVLFNQKNCPHQNTRYISIEEIHVSEDGLYTPEGERIYYLYRLYPIEYFIDDGEIGLQFIDLIEEGKVKIINPISAFVTQSKGLFAVIHEIYKNDRNLYTEEEQGWILKYIPYTSYDSSDFKHRPYVAKPILGREGGGVSIYDTNGQLEVKDKENHYSIQKKVYQEYIKMPDIEINTWDGSYKGKLLIGSFLIGGQPSGLFLRVGEKITGNLSMFVGIGTPE